MTLSTDMRRAAPLERVVSLSRYLQRLLDSRPEIAEELDRELSRPFTAQAMQACLAETVQDEASLKPALRRLRARVFARVAARDLAGLASLAEVTVTMSALADQTLRAAVDVLSARLRERYGEPRGPDGAAQELIVVGMGKLGGHELNVSSDIDLIFVYPEDGETTGPAVIDNFDYFTRLGRALIGALAEITADGQVFRVDMRLRPNGDSGPLVGSFEMLEHYLISQGREWERYAWIKARPITGSPERWEQLAQITRPFVFRKYLDYGTFDALRDLHAQIRREVTRRDKATNVKLGPGGIREIEFIAQVFQIIRGGRDSALQARPTLEVLDRLNERGILGAEAVRQLKSAYEFLRRLEHRLQYLDDAQTHDLPARPEDQAVIARAMGFFDWEALATETDDHRANVTRHFDTIFTDPNQNGHHLTGVWQASDGGDESVAELRRLGYGDAAAAAARLAAIRHGSRYQQMARGNRERFDALIPRVIEVCAEAPNADATLSRTLDLLEAISRRAAYLALLQQYPSALKRVASLNSASSWAAGYLNRHPILLDELLDPRLLETAPDWRAFYGSLKQRLDELEPDQESQMDVMRDAHHAQVFRLLTQDLAGMLTVERLADHLSELADLILDLTVTLCWRKLRQRHRQLPRFAVISYGKLGGKELGYASDLDLIFLYEDEAPEALEIYARLAQRVNTWLSTRTGSGILFETDLRLRPNGAAGLIVSSMASFRKYQAEAAWVWEHQALTRARFSAGDQAMGLEFESIRVDILRWQRDLAELKREVLQMRERMRKAHGNKSDLFDLKHDRGGLIDVEFAVQYLVLGYSHRHPELTANLGNIKLLGIAAELGLIGGDLAGRVQHAYREYRRLQHALRLNDARHARVEPSLVAREIGDVTALWREVFGAEGQHT